MTYVMGTWPSARTVEGVISDRDISPASGTSPGSGTGPSASAAVAVGALLGAVMLTGAAFAADRKSVV